MSFRDAYLSEKAEKDAEEEADRKADEKYEKERLNSPSAYFEWFVESKSPRLQTYQGSVSSPRLQTYPGSSDENGSPSVPR